MPPFDKYFPIYQNTLDQYEKDHPNWQIEVLGSLIKWGLKNLKHYIEDVRDSEITWEKPLAELHYPIGWNWKKGEPGNPTPGGHIFGTITTQNTRTKQLAIKTLSQIMANHLNAMTLADLTNWAWYEKRNNKYLPRLTIQLAEMLHAIHGKKKQRDVFDEIVRPFSIGAVRVDQDYEKFKSGARIPKEARQQLVESCKQMNIKRIQFTGDVNGRRFEMGLIFEVHPLMADYNQKKAYHPITVGLAFTPRIEGGEIIEDTPSGWPASDREKFWEGLLEKIDEIPKMLMPEEEKGDSVILAVNSKLKIPATWWRPENRCATIKLATDVLGQFGEIAQFAVEEQNLVQDVSPVEKCHVCGWTHDAGFTQIKTNVHEINLIGGILPEIVAVVHRAHEKGFKELSTKDDELKKICDGYKNPCKAFDDKKHRDDYKALFYTRRKGFISLRGTTGIMAE